jgi:hypothetical protein
MKMEQTQCCETSAIKHKRPENNPNDYTRNSEHGESFKSKTGILLPMIVVRKQIKNKLGGETATLNLEA